MRWTFCVLVASLACRDPIDELDPPELENARATEVFRPQEPPGPDAPLRIRYHKVRSLVEDAARLEMRRSGLVIDMGTPDQHKYLPPWQAGRIKAAKGDGAHATAEIRGEVTYQVDVRNRPVEHVLVRAKATRARQRLLLYLNGRYIADRSLTTSWKTHHFRLANVLKPGVHQVKLALSGGHGQRMRLDWVYLRDSSRSGTRTPPLNKVALRDHGRPARALVGDPPRTYSVWLEVPPEGSLIFDYGGDPEVQFKVSVVADRGGRTQVLKQTAGPIYQEANISLARWEGELVRIELTTEGKGKAAWADPWIARPGRPPQRQIVEARRPRGLVMLVIDTLRQDVFRTFNGRTHVFTPAFDALAQEAFVFENAYTTAPWTKPSVGTLLTGLYPSSHGAQSEISRLSSRLTLLSELLQKHGFQTALISGNGYISDYFGFAQGWDTYVNLPREKERTQAKDVYARALDWLKKVPKDRPFFLYLQTVDPHVPYQTPSRYISRYLTSPYDGTLGPAVSGTELNNFNEGTLAMSESDRTFVRAMYDAEVTYHDTYMGRFVKDLRKLGLLDDLILVITNDHGEELFDHGKLDHGHSLYDELIRAPLLMRHPASFNAGRYSPPVSIIDIPPTVLEILGVLPLPNMQGRSLFAALQGAPSPSPAYAIAQRSTIERAIRMGPYKFILQQTGTRELYDLRRDPGELTNLADLRPIALRTCEIHLFEGLQIPRALERPNGMSARVRFRAGTAKPDRALMKHLRTLGYFNN